MSPAAPRWNRLRLRRLLALVFTAGPLLAQSLRAGPGGVPPPPVPDPPPPAYPALPEWSAPQFAGLGPVMGQPSRARGLSANGHVVVGTRVWGGCAFRWSLATGLVVLSKDPGAEAFAAGGDGASVFGMSGLDSRGRRLAMSWSDAGEVALRSSLFPSDAFALSERGHPVSADGELVVGTMGSTEAGAHPAQWTPTLGWVVLQTLRDGRLMYQPGMATAVSDDARVIVGTLPNPEGGGRIPYRWTRRSGTPRTDGLGDFAHLPHPPEALASEPLAASFDGSTIVGICTTPIGEEACRWSPWEGVARLEGPDGRARSAAFAVSDDMTITVGKAYQLTKSGGRDRAVIWDVVHGARWLESVLADAYGLGSPLRGWMLTEARAIASDAGFYYLAGNGFNPVGQYEAWWARIPRPLR